MEPAMPGDEIGAGQAITIEEDAKRAGACPYAAVADFAAAETAMLVADMLERHRQTRFPALDDARGVRPRAVVGNDDFEGFVRLMGERAERGIKRILAIIGGDNDGNERLSHGLPPLRIVAEGRTPNRSRSRSRRLPSRNLRIGRAK